jgi:hypothetical protein
MRSQTVSLGIVLVLMAAAEPPVAAAQTPRKTPRQQSPASSRDVDRLVNANERTARAARDLVHAQSNDSKRLDVLSLTIAFMSLLVSGGVSIFALRTAGRQASAAVGQLQQGSPRLTHVPPGVSDERFIDASGALAVREGSEIIESSVHGSLEVSVPIRNVGSSTAFLADASLRMGHHRLDGKFQSLLPAGEATRLSFRVPEECAAENIWQLIVTYLGSGLGTNEQLTMQISHDGITWQIDEPEIH